VSQVQSPQEALGIFPQISQGSGSAHQQLCIAMFSYGTIAFEASKCSHIENNSKYLIKLIQLVIKSGHD